MKSRSKRPAHLGRTEYELLYSLLEDVTPLNQDCGDLCGKICCRGLTQESGMYLFPGEEVMFGSRTDLTWCRIETHDVAIRQFCPLWEGRIKSVGFLVCEGECPRHLRPLACRLFPLVAVAHSFCPTLDLPDPCVYHIDVILDPDAAFICPLVRHASLTQLNPTFVHACRQAYSVLARDPLILADILWSTERRKADTLMWSKFFGR